MSTPPATARKTILLTGASSGIGSALAREFSRLGHRLALTARRADRLEALASELGGEILILPASLDDPATPVRLVAETVGRFGSLDVLVNNAGFGLPTFFTESDPDAIRSQIEVNFTAPILLTRHALPHLIAARGTVINVGSSITTVANPVFGAYGATKAGLAWWNDALRRELIRRRVSVCLVEPGPVATEFFDRVQPQGGESPGSAAKPPPPFATARPEDVARRIARLLDHPRRRISVLRRVVWPMRVLGGLIQIWPALGDLALGQMAPKPPAIERRKSSS